MGIAWVFPGQGSQKIGMAAGLLEHPLAKERFELASDLLGRNLAQICAGTCPEIENDLHNLNNTRNTQPALFVLESLLVDLLHQQEKQADLLAGHSLGELVGLYAGSVFKFETGLQLVIRRSELMAAAAEGAMVAVIGFNRSSLEEAVAATADVVIAIATEFSDVDIIYTGKRVGQPRLMIRVDLDTTQLQSGLTAEIGVISDAALFASALTQALTDSGFVSSNQGAPAAAAKASADIGWTNQSRSHFAWLDVINEQMPANAIVSLDSTQLAYTAHHYTPWSTPSRWLAPYGLGTLGPALPMGIGAKVAAPKDPVVIIAGDGGVLFTISELATARDVSGTIVTIIWDNAGYGEIRDSFDRAKADRNGVDISSFDLTDVAKGFGMNASRVRTPDELRTQFKKALSMNTPSVIIVTEPGSPADKK